MAGKKILVLDDSPLVRKLAEVSLQEAGYEVYTAADGEEGLKIAEEIKPDLILVDFIMPKMTGSQVCKLIRENETLKDIPIILITGKGESVGQTFIEKYGILDYFIKPFKSEELVEKINQLLGKTPEFAKIKEEVPKEEVPAFTYEPTEIEIKEEEIEPSVLPETEEVLFFEEKEIDLTKEIELEEPQKVEEFIEPPKLEISEELAIFEKEEIASVQSLSEEPAKPEIEEIKTQEIIKEEMPAPDLTSFEKIIEEKFNAFSEKITFLLDTSVEASLRKYGLVKDSSFILSGNLSFFKLPDIFALINSNSLNGILSVYGNTIAYEFLFIEGQVIYGISNLQRQKIGFKLLNEFSQEEIKDITLEALTSLIKLQGEKFIFEKKDFSEPWVLNKTKFNPSDLFQEALKMI